MQYHKYLLKFNAVLFVVIDNEACELLFLAGNSIGDTGVRAIAEMLKVNRGLKGVDLSSNSIEYDGAIALGEAVNQNQNLKSLYLGTLKFANRLGKIKFYMLTYIFN